MAFEKSGGLNRRPFFTEFLVFQLEEGPESVVSTQVPPNFQLLCSSSSRAYASDGRWKQASTGFYKFQKLDKV
jgi:hypothetical protein